MSVTVVLYLEKDYTNITNQIDNLLSQTKQPEKIIIINNSTDLKYYGTHNITVININKKINEWIKFSIALNATTTYVCIINENIFIDNKWLELCSTKINDLECVFGYYGTIYKNGNYEFVPNNQDYMQVDYVRHLYFFKKDILEKILSGLGHYELNNSTCDIYIGNILKKYNYSLFITPINT
jgi:hypothetical protein